MANDWGDEPASGANEWGDLPAKAAPSMPSQPPYGTVPRQPGFFAQTFGPLLHGASAAWNMVKPGQYPHAPAGPPRQRGESDADYARRAAHAALNPSGATSIGGALTSMDPRIVEQTSPFMAYVAPGAEQEWGPLLPKSSAAAALERQGVKGLTVGQMAPDSALAQIEAVSTKNPLGMQTAREAAKDSWRLSELRKTQKLGAPPLPTDLQSATAEAYSRFGPEYDAISKVPIPGEALQGLPEAAAKTPGGVAASTRAGARAAIEDALSALPQAPEAPKPSGLVDARGNPIVTEAPEPPPSTAGDLMKVRSLIREEMRSARTAQDYDRLNQLGHAHDVVTDALEQNLPPDAANNLKDIDRRYSLFSTIEGAAPAGQTEFTPGQLARSAERSSGRRAFKQGEAGPLQASSQAAQKVFSDAPQTGFRSAVMSALPGLSYAAAPISRIANTAAGKRFLFETGRPPIIGGPSAPGLAAPIARLQFLPLSAAAQQPGSDRGSQ